MAKLRGRFARRKRDVPPAGRVVAAPPADAPSDATDDEAEAEAARAAAFAAAMGDATELERWAAALLGSASETEPWEPEASTAPPPTVPSGRATTLEVRRRRRACRADQWSWSPSGEPESSGAVDGGTPRRVEDAARNPRICAGRHTPACRSVGGPQGQAGSVMSPAAASQATDVPVVASLAHATCSWMKPAFAFALAFSLRIHES